MKTALAVIDVQAYFLARGPADLPAKIAAHINKSQYDLVVFTAFQNRPGSTWEKNLHWSKAMAAVDWELPTELKPLAKNLFTKTSYSAFKDGGFADCLKKAGITKLDLCGIDLDACVLATAYDAFDLGYEVEVLFDLSYSRAGFGDPAEQIILRNLQTKNVPRSY